MKVSKKIILYLSISFIICNLPPFSGILTAIFVDLKGAPFGFITKDLHFCMFGGIEKVNSSKAYKDYVRRYADKDHELYRFNKEKNYTWFWRYGEYLFNLNWQVPFLEVPSDFSTERYYGAYIDEDPQYRWNEKEEKWDRIPSSCKPELYHSASMEILIMSTFLVLESYVSIRSWEKLLKSENVNFTKLVKGVSVAFMVIFIWELVRFLQNENGKSFTIGWLALELFLLNLFSAYTLFCWILAKFSGREI